MILLQLSVTRGKFVNTILLGKAKLIAGGSWQKQRKTDMEQYTKLISSVHSYSTV